MGRAIQTSVESAGGDRGRGLAGPKAARVYDILRDAIISTRLQPGARLVEKDLCEELGVSRTPLRDAIQRLAQQRLVTVVPSDATFVNRIALDEVIEGQILRESVELRMVALAAERYTPDLEEAFTLILFREALAAKRKDGAEAFALDNELHRLICTCAGFPGMWDTISGATGQLDRVRHRSFPLEDFHDEVHEEHQGIVAAIRSRDPKAAAERLKPHLLGNLRSLRILLAREPDLVACDPGSPAFAILESLIFLPCTDPAPARRRKGARGPRTLPEKV
jgi:DNA-binding GntR family transcriptional regulator